MRRIDSMAKAILTHRFANGFRVVYQSSEQAIPLTSFHIICNVGSSFEKDGIRGISHFVEHMCFKGTHEIEKPRDILREYNKVGAYFNAFTDKRLTGYVVKCEDSFVLHSIQRMADMVLHSTFSKKEFQKEQHVVIEENIRSEDDPHEVLERLMEKVFFGGSSFENDIDAIEYHPTANHLKHADVQHWYKWFYHPSNMICSIVSHLSFSTILSYIKKTDLVKSRPIDGSPPRLALQYPILTLNPISDGQRIHIEYQHKKGLSATTLQIGFRTCSRFSANQYKFNMLKTILNGMSGKLFTELRTQKGLTYRSYCYTTYQEHTGYVTIYIQTDPHKLIHATGRQDGVLPTVMRILMNLKRSGPTEEEIQVAKGKMKGNMLMDTEAIDFITHYNGTESIFSDSFLPYQELYSRCYARITKKQLDDVIQEYMIRENMVVGILYGKDVPKSDIEAICNRFH